MLVPVHAVILVVIKTSYYPTDAPLDCAVHTLSASLDCAVHTLSACLDCAVHTRNTGKYAAITPTTFMSTDTIEPFL